MKNPKIGLLIAAVLLLNAISLICLYSALHKSGEFTDAAKATLIKQVIWIALGWVIAIGVSFVNYRLFYDLAGWIYWLSFFSLILGAILGTVKMGAQRWIELLGVTFQPSELAKLATLLIVARSFSKEKRPGPNLLVNFWQQALKPFLPLVFLCILIFIQPDLGTALIILLFFIFMLIGCGGKRRNVVIFSLLILTLLPLGWNSLQDYQKNRLMVFQNPNADPLGAGYTIIQSKIAIGSGQLLGKGFLSGTQNQLNFIPARHTDFIFTVFAEEWGFLGCLLLLSLFYFLLKIILDTAAQTKDSFAYVLCIGIFSLFFLHIFINLAMVMGLLPVVGLPLLFFSYGGSYTLISFILIGITLNILRNA